MMPGLVSISASGGITFSSSAADDGDDLERRARLVDVLHGAVAARGFVEASLYALGLNVGQLAIASTSPVLRVHDDRGAAVGALLFDASAQLALDDVLQLLVDGQLERAAAGRRALETAEDAAAGVGLDEERALAAADDLVVGRFEAAEADVVEADVAEQVRRQLLVRIEAAALLHEADAFEVERGDVARFERASTRRLT